LSGMYGGTRRKVDYTAYCKWQKKPSRKPKPSPKAQTKFFKFLDVAAQSAPEIPQWVSICYRMFGWTLLCKGTDAE